MGCEPLSDGQPRAVSRENIHVIFFMKVALSRGYVYNVLPGLLRLLNVSCCRWSLWKDRLLVDLQCHPGQ